MPELYVFVLSYGEMTCVISGMCTLFALCSIYSTWVRIVDLREQSIGARCKRQEALT